MEKREGTATKESPTHAWQEEMQRIRKDGRK